MQSAEKFQGYEATLDDGKTYARRVYVVNAREIDGQRQLKIIVGRFAGYTSAGDYVGKDGCLGNARAQYRFDGAKYWVAASKISGRKHG